MAAKLVENLVSRLFEGLDYEEYLSKFPFYQALGVERPRDSALAAKIEKAPLDSVDPSNTEPYPAEFDDLIRLHWLATSRRAVTVLEIGSGFSTGVFDHAMQVNATIFPDFDGAAHRKSDVFIVHSLDSSEDWIEQTRRLGPLERVVFHFSEVEMASFQGRVCTLFSTFPNVAPDLIYLDGPDQHNVIGNVRGITTSHVDRFPMSADLLAIEHFLSPGTLVVVDGRTANSRFLASNLQRDWIVEHSETYDQTFFELNERPLGRFNRKLLDFQKLTNCADDPGEQS